jgi:DNA-binding transcriptional MerR regulator
MFTQLDLFGDLPSPEKPSDKPTRSEKRNSTRNVASGTTQPAQAQLTMGLPEQEFSQDEKRMAENNARSEQPKATDIQASVEKTEDTAKTPETKIPPQDPLQSIAAPVESVTQTDISVPDQSGTRKESNGVPSRGPSEKTVLDRPSSTGKRYYIQTEIPADPPIAPRQVLEDAGMLAQTPVRQSIPEAKPRYIQTEIPSDPPVTEGDLPERSVPTSQSDETSQQFMVDPATTTISSRTEDTSVVEARESENKPAARSMAPENLRRTRPLMPPKVILAEPSTETPFSSSPALVSVANEKQKAEEKNNAAEKEVNSVVQLPENSNNKIAAAEINPTTAAAALGNEAVPEDEISKVETLPQEPDMIPAADVFTVADSAVKKTGSRSKKTIRETPAESTNPGIPADEILNSRQYYSIGEVAVMFSVKPSLLRYWESEFDVLKLRKNRKGDRFFRPDDIRSLQLIHHLLREKKYTIDGAREYMRNARKMNEKFETIEALQRIRQFLVEMRNGLQEEKLEDIH